MQKTLLFLLALATVACQNAGSEPVAPRLTDLPLPAGATGGESSLFAASDGQIYLSWVAYENDTTDALLFSRLTPEGWSEPRRIAAGSDWFVNWADFPSLAVYPGGGQQMAAHWLAMSADGTYDYDVWIAQSADGGQTWGEPFRPHTDGIPAEHGFVSLLPLGPDRMLAAWLDGRHTKAEAGAAKDHAHAHGGAMTLRTATFDPQGNLYDEAELDDRVCDCCQTGAALTANGPVIVYRDRSEAEVRDIFIVRQVNGQWTEPAPVRRDDWKIAGCPVNGPAIVAEDLFTAVAWFTAAADSAQVKIAFSTDGGASFGPPVRIDQGRPLGRVDLILLGQDEVMITWLENPEAGAEVRGARVTPAGMQGDPFTLLTTDAGRQSGFPRLAKAGDAIVLSWTAVQDETTMVKTVKIEL